MTEPNTLPPDIHPTVALLPWYVNGTLSGTDRTAVATHLQECPSCRTELDELIRMGAQIKQAIHAEPSPSASLADTVLSRVRETVQRDQAHLHPSPAITVESHSFVRSIDLWLRNLFLPQWVPTLIATLVVAQLGVLLWAVSQRIPSVEVGGSITSRGLGSPTARFRVEFQPSASMQQIQTLLQGMHGRVLDGPTADGAYIMEIPAPDSAAIEQHLRALQNRHEVIRHAEILSP